LSISLFFKPTVSNVINLQNITVVTWCFGHMLDVTDKEGAAKVWRVDVLPIVPDALVTVPPAEVSHETDVLICYYDLKLMSDIVGSEKEIGA
jgi:DNA topoisomerase IA